MPISGYRFQIMCWLSRPILLRMAAMLRGTDATGPPECRSTGWSTDWGCSLQPNLLRVVTTSGWIALNDRFDCRLAYWSTIQADFMTRTYDHKAKYNRLAYFNNDLTQWTAAQWMSFSSRFLKEKQIKNGVCKLLTIGSELNLINKSTCVIRRESTQLFLVVYK